jgi:mRNA interferase MazF
MINKIRRNEIYLANLGETVGSEEKGVRPVLIIQNDIGNKHSPTTIIIPMTKRIENQNSIPTHIKIKAFGKIKCRATIMAEQIKVIDKRRLIKRIDILPREYINEVDRAIRIATNLQERNCYEVYR